MGSFFTQFRFPDQKQRKEIQTVDYQLEHYGELDYTKSFRKVAAWFSIIIAPASLVYFEVAPQLLWVQFLGCVVLLISAFFIYRGRGWAMIVSGGTATALGLLASPKQGVPFQYALTALIFFYLIRVWKAYEVERVRTLGREAAEATRRSPVANRLNLALIVIGVLAILLRFGIQSQQEETRMSGLSKVLATTGFAVNNKDDFVKLMEAAQKNGTVVTAVHGSYKVWRVGQGVELWLHLDKSGTAQSFDVFYNGQSSLNFTLESLQREGDDSMHGLAYGWVNLKNQDDFGEGYPLVVDIIDFDNFAATVKPSTTINLKITVDAREVNFYDSVAEYEQVNQARLASSSDGLKLSAGFFVPSGTFNSPETADAWFSGYVTAYQSLKNPVGNSFNHLLVDTYGGTYDVVANPAITKGEPKVGGVVEVDGSLIGQLVSS